MHTKTSKGKEIRIPGPDHPITISPAEGKVRVRSPGGSSLNRRKRFGWRRRDIRLFITCRATMQTCRCSFGPRITAIVRTRVIVRTTAFPSADRNRNTPFGHTKNLMRQSPRLKNTWRFIPHGSMQSSDLLRMFCALLGSRGGALKRHILVIVQNGDLILLHGTHPAAIDSTLRSLVNVLRSPFSATRKSASFLHG
jgi:hypothetical protein